MGTGIVGTGSYGLRDAEYASYVDLGTGSTAVRVEGQLSIGSVDIQIGAVELKDQLTDNRATIAGSRLYVDARGTIIAVGSNAVGTVAIGKALVHLYNRQTSDEQRTEDTKYNNGIGFTPADARMGTSMATFFQRRGYLTPKQIAYWRKPNAKGTPRILKYKKQLLEEALRKQAEKV